jgi:hypothetical protein
LAIMKNWLTAANLMYRQVLVNSLASSASSGSSGTMLWVSSPNRRAARSRTASLRADTIWGSEYSSAIAWPSAIRSGQKATSTATSRSATIRSTSAVTPGYTVLRNTRSCPSWK